MIQRPELNAALVRGSNLKLSVLGSPVSGPPHLKEKQIGPQLYNFIFFPLKRDLSCLRSSLIAQHVQKPGSRPKTLINEIQKSLRHLGIGSFSIPHK